MLHWDFVGEKMEIPKVSLSFDYLGQPTMNPVEHALTRCDAVIGRQTP